MSGTFPELHGRNASMLEKSQHTERSRAEIQKKKDSNDIV